MISTIQVARARRTDPATSHAAARSVRDLTAKQAAVLDVFRDLGPLTDEAAFTVCRVVMSPSGFRTRRSELVERGLLRDSGARRRLPSGRSAIVWEVAS